MSSRITRSARSLVLLTGLLLAACSTTDVSDDGEAVNDPLEGVNRVVYGFNTAADILVIEPVATIYDGTVPDPIKQVVRNFLRNLKAPIIAFNELLQGDMEGFDVAMSRFFVNTIAGAGGIVDIAGMDPDYAYRSEDFGQTLAVWGLDDTPYLVLPLIGPSSLGDGIGLAVDTTLDPFNFAWRRNDQNERIIIRSVANALDARVQVLQAVRDMRQNSIDSYAVMRASYIQLRRSEVRDGKMDDYALPSFDFDDDN